MSHANLPVAVHAILIKNSQVLLLHRKNTGFNDDKWSIPAGRLEEAESITQGMIREIKEEVGLEIDLADLGSPLVMNHHDERGERLYVFFISKKWSGIEINCEPNKCDKIAWFGFDNLPVNLLAHIRVAIEASLRGESYIEFGF